MYKIHLLKNNLGGLKYLWVNPAPKFLSVSSSYHYSMVG